MRTVTTFCLVLSLLSVYVYAGENHWNTTTTSNPQTSGSDSPDVTYTNPIFGICCQTLSSHTHSAGTASCSASATGSCFRHTLHTGSFSSSAQATASYNYQEVVVWHGPCPAPFRNLSFTASGGGSEGVSVSANDDSGTSASAAASGSGSCSSLGNASADLTMHSLSLYAAYNAATSKIDVSGNAGADVDDNSASITGHYSQSSSWELVGVGSKSGSASYSVKAGRSYNGYTDSGYTRARSGSVNANGNSTCTAGGSSSYSASASVNLTV